MSKQARALLDTVWSGQQGYTFVAGIDWSRKKPHLTDEQPFKWPAQRDELLAYADELAAKGQDVYFSAGLFSKPRRQAEHARKLPLIWADVDDAPLDGVKATQPTALWQTSPGRYQAMWVLDKPLPVAAGSFAVQRAISHLLKCDPAGWDASQLLRLPGYPSHKHDGVMVRLAKPGKPTTLAQVLRRSVLAASGSLALTSSRLAQTVATGDRSDQVFAMTSELTRAGLDKATIVGLIRHTPWNKFDDVELLAADVERSMAKVPKRDTLPHHDDPDDASDDDEPRPRLQVISLEELASIKPPKWLVEDLIEEAGCGFIAGPPKQFKSWVMLDIAASLAQGGKVVDYFSPASTDQVPVLVVEAEDSAARLSQRLGIVMRDKFGIKQLKHVKAPLHIISKPPILFGDDFYSDLVGIIDKYGIKLVAYDTLSMLTTENLNDSKDMYGKVLRPLKTIAQAKGCAQLLVHHTRKSSVGVASSGGAALAGSVALHAWSDNSLYMHRNEANEVDQATVTLEVETKATATKQLTLENMDKPGHWTPKVITAGAGEQDIAESVDDGVTAFMETRRQKHKER